MVSKLASDASCETPAWMLALLRPGDTGDMGLQSMTSSAASAGSAPSAATRKRARQSRLRDRSLGAVQVPRRGRADGSADIDRRRVEGDGRRWRAWGWRRTRRACCIEFNAAKVRPGSSRTAGSSGRRRGCRAGATRPIRGAEENIEPWKIRGNPVRHDDDDEGAAMRLPMKPATLKIAKICDF